MAKTKGGAPPAEATKGDVLFVRTSPELLAALDAEAAELREQLGVKVTRSDVARRILTKGLEHRLRPAQTEKSAEGAPGARAQVTVTRPTPGASSRVQPKAPPSSKKKARKG
jgi:hypothetical protein